MESQSIQTSRRFAFAAGIAARIRIYQELAKSGIVTLVLISVFGGFLAGHPLESPFSWNRMLVTLAGILLLASGSSALNQFQERETDGRMPRTAGRPLPSGRISAREAAAFVGVTLGAGFAFLGSLGPELFILGAAAVLSYNALYTPFWKRRLPFAAVPGAIPGALPILMGHVAASGSWTTPGGWYLFALLFFWQMPHFWVLALRYAEDYRLGDIPTLPVRHGPGLTVRQISVWGLAYCGIALVAPLFFPVGNLYLLTAFALSFWVLLELRRFAKAPEGKAWLRFFLGVNFSLVGYIAVLNLDLWSVLLIRWWTR